MGSPPTFVAAPASAWNTATSPKSVSVTTSVDDVLVVCGIGADVATDFGTPSGGGLTYELLRLSGAPSNCRVNTWATVADAATTFSVSLAKTSGTDHWGLAVVQFSASVGYATTGSAVLAAQGSGAPTTNLTTTADNPAVVGFVGDWAAVNASRTWRTINGITPTSGNGLETAFLFDTGAYTIYAAYWSDAGAAGSVVTPGLSAPAGQTYTLSAVEVFGDTAPRDSGGGKMTPSARQLLWQQQL